MFQKILIANRGEIACRIIRTAKRLGIETVAIYSEADKNARHTQLADQAFCVGPAPSIDSYLQQDKIIQIAKQHGVQAIHPGYGFLSENAEFAEKCFAAQIEFIGPPSSAIHAMGSKSNAKALMAKAGVPLLPGYHGADQSEAVLLQKAQEIGFPLLIKPAAGGGGKGMYIVNSLSEMPEKIIASKREAKSSFNDDTLLLEKYLAAPKHIEIQIVADKLQNCVHCSERDCSTQRRHQKIIEEAPAFLLSEKTRELMGKAAVDCAKAIGYVGAGTVEFLLTDDAFYFMEMNTRLQVEHPVTEMVLGIDLVEWQLRIASGEPLPKQQHELQVHGHAIEARIYAEDPAAQFLPSIGRLEICRFPSDTAQWRIDTGVQQGDFVSMYYDPMLAKVIVWGESRLHAIAQMQRCLQECQIIGVTTNIDFLLSLLKHPQFIASGFSTGFIDTHLAELIQPTPVSPLHLAIAGLFLHLNTGDIKTPLRDPYSPWNQADGFQSALPAWLNVTFQTVQNGAVSVTLLQDQQNYNVTVGDDTFSLQGKLVDQVLTIYHQNTKISLEVIPSQNSWTFFGLGSSFVITQPDPLQHYANAQTRSGHLNAPMPGTVVDVMVEAGSYVEKGTSLMVIEAMKMEHTIHAPTSGVIAEIYFNKGDIVGEGVELLAFVAEEVTP